MESHPQSVHHVLITPFHFREDEEEEEEEEEGDRERERDNCVLLSILVHTGWRYVTMLLLLLHTAIFLALPCLMASFASKSIKSR